LITPQNIDEFMSRRFLFPNCMHPDNCEFIPQFVSKKEQWEKVVSIKGGIKLPCSNSGLGGGDGSVFGYYVDFLLKNIIFLDKLEERKLITFLVGSNKDTNSILFLLSKDVINIILHIYIQKIYQTSGYDFLDYSKELCKQFISKSNIEVLGKICLTMHYTTCDWWSPMQRFYNNMEFVMNNLKKTEKILYPAEILVEKRGIYEKGVEISKEEEGNIYIIVLWCALGSGVSAVSAV